MKKILLLAGTKKGLFLFTSGDRKRWQPHGPFLKGKEVNTPFYDPRVKKIFATANDAWFGSETVSSANLGKTWKSAEEKSRVRKKFRLEAGPHLAHRAVPRKRAKKSSTPASRPRRFFAATIPARPGAKSRASRDIPRARAGIRARAGFACNSIAVDPANAQRMFVGISAVGVFRTDDGGETWHTANRGTRADFQPVKHPEFGQCVHKLLMPPGDSSLLFQQNHCGVYSQRGRRRKLGRDHKKVCRRTSVFRWRSTRASQKQFMSSAQGAEFRCPPENKLRVFRSRNGGKTWKALNERTAAGRGRSWGFCAKAWRADRRDPAGIYFGTKQRGISRRATRAIPGKALAATCRGLFVPK